MKNIVLSAVAVLAMSSFAVAGGDIAPVEEPIVVVEEPVVTDSGFYLGLAYTYMNATSEINDGDVFNWNDGYELSDADINTGMFQAGYKFNSYVAVEGRYWFGGSETIAHVPDSAGIGRDVDIDIDSWGIYVKPMYPVSDAFDIYALLGYADNGYELSAITVKGDVSLNPDADIDGFSWGIGAAYSFNDNMSVFVDYTVLYDDETDWHADLVVEDVIDTINFGVTYQF